MHKKKKAAESSRRQIARSEYSGQLYSFIFLSSLKMATTTRRKKKQKQKQKQKTNKKNILAIK